jgi:hypothetical protein
MINEKMGLLIDPLYPATTGPVSRRVLSIHPVPGWRQAYARIPPFNRNLAEAYDQGSRKAEPTQASGCPRVLAGGTQASGPRKRMINAHTSSIPAIRNHEVEDWATGMNH